MASSVRRTRPRHAKVTPTFASDVDKAGRRAVHIKQIAEELGVRYIVEGSVRKADNRVRITAQLNDATTGGHLWAERYDRELVDVFAVQDEITGQIVAAIERQIHDAERDLSP